MARQKLTGFKAYDIRGKVPEELDERMAEHIGRAFALLFKPGKVVVGRDMRPTGERLVEALTRGLTAAGVDVLDIGLVGTEQVYFAVFALEVGGGIMVTASHNPAEYNGMKLVREKAIPISSETGLADIERLVADALAGDSRAPDEVVVDGSGSVERRDIQEPYIEHLLGYLEPEGLRRLKIVANGGDGMAGPIVKALAEHLPLDFEILHGEPDGTFPNGVPNPLLPENREATARAVREAGADLGLAWDGDFDRCFFWDERGEFVDGYYLVGLLAQGVLRRHQGAKIVHDPRLIWNTLEIVNEQGGVAVQSKSGHSFIKERMRAEDAAYGGEMSAHHYFREFSYADSGMIPWLLVADLLSTTGRPLSDLVSEMQRRYPISGEINTRLSNPDKALARLKEEYGSSALSVDETDGISIEFADWRFNVRPSNTEPLIRLNLETRGEVELVEQKTRELLAFLEREGA